MAYLLAELAIDKNRGITYRDGSDRVLMMSKSILLIVSLRPGTDPSQGILVDRVSYADAMKPGSMAAFELRSRFNPEIRSMLVRAPVGTTPDRWADAFEAMSLEERTKLYSQATNL